MLHSHDGGQPDHPPSARMSQRVVHSHVPLKIMTVPLCTQVGAVKVYMKFVEFLARRVIALQERLGPGSSMVPLESESGG